LWKKREIDRKVWNNKKERLTERELRGHRRSRREYTRAYREKKAVESNQTTKPMSFEVIELDCSSEMQTEVSEMLSPKSISTIRREWKKLSVENKTLKKRNESLTTIVRMMRSRLFREKAKHSTIRCNINSLPEASKIQSNINQTLASRRKTLIAVASYYRLLNSIKRKYELRRRLGSTFKEISTRHGSQTQLVNGLQGHASTIRRGTSSNIDRITKVPSSIFEIFYCRDDNSRITAGKKETVTRHGDKMQVSE
jgi:hypothetical protein